MHHVARTSHGEQRAKLVFLAEARPDAASTLRPGQPVDVKLAK